ncbi:MAG TPA: DNA primase [Marinilabiliales bacterium]|nr:DNA primase [Marinilabiliales bacterium]
MDIPTIKTRLKITQVLEHYHLKPDRNHRLLCPFHDDKTPSLQVYPDTNTWTCFSTNCHAGSGDVIDFILNKEGFTKHEAIEKAKILAGAMGIAPTKSKQPEGLNQSKDAVLSASKDTTPEGLFASFLQSLPRSQKALAYVKERGLEKVTKIGYNPGSQTTQMKYCLVFPLKDNQNNTVSFYGRSILNDSDKRHYYSANRKGLYPEYPATTTQTLILTEAVIDAATLLQVSPFGGDLEGASVLSLYGTNGLTDEHLAAIKQLPELTEIILFLDGDEAGRKATEKHFETLHNLFSETSISYVETPEGEDINSLYVKYDKDAILQLIDERNFLFSIEKEKEEKPQLPLQQSVQAPSPLERAGERLLNTRNPEYITFEAYGLLFVLLGGLNLHQLDRMRVTLKISVLEAPVQSIRHTVDLYNDDLVEKLIGKTSERLETECKTLRLAIARLTEQLEQYRLNHLESLKTKAPARRTLTPERVQQAITYLRSPDLLELTGRDIGRTGMVGEENNRLLMFLIFTSRLRETPLHIISLGASGSGKTYLQEKVSELIPEHDKLEVTILSENAFYYFGQKELKHKLVLIEDMDGAENVLYPLRELQSKKKISKTVPIKDNKGNLKTITLQVEGPICLAGTTTKERLYEDNANRSILIYLDSSPEHKEKIMEYQRKLSAGKINTAQEQQVKELLRDVQSVLKPVKVRNPFAELLKLPDYIFKPLRTNSHYLQFIEIVTFYHQYQRKLQNAKSPSCGGVGEAFIETTVEDIEAANELLKDVLLTKADELPKIIRDFFEGLKYHLKASQKQSFYSKDVRNRLRLNPMTVNRYIRDLEHRGYIKRAGGNRKNGFEYEVANWEEYGQLQEGMKVLAQVLEGIKSKHNNRPKAEQVSVTQV